MKKIKYLFSIFGINFEEEIFLTHTPEHYMPGTIIDDMIVTRQKRTFDVSLLDDFNASCWIIYGRKA